jgi:hypothetical protein
MGSSVVDTLYDCHLLKTILFNITGSQTGVGGICPVGHYCPGETSHPIPCTAGSFSNVTGLSTCYDCPVGYYCLQGNVILLFSTVLYLIHSTFFSREYHTINMDISFTYKIIPAKSCEKTTHIQTHRRGCFNT